MKILTLRGLACLAYSVALWTTAQAQTTEAQDQSQSQSQNQSESQVHPPTRPMYLDLRYDEDWSRLKSGQGPGDFWDPVKRIPLGDRGWYMSLGGEIRQRYDSWHNANFGYTPSEYLNSSLQRYMFHADTHFGNRVRVFVQTQSALEFGKTGGPWYTDKDTFEIHQAFVDIRLSGDDRNYTLLRVGRQEIALGADHFVSTGDFFNARKVFDGARLIVVRGSWTWLLEATKPVIIREGAFDDAPEHGRTSWGGGFFAPNPLTQRGRIGVFYIALDTKRQLWNRGLGRDQRHTIGARIEGAQKNGVDYTYETLLQVGTFTPVQGSDMPIRAWAVTTDTGFTFQKSHHFPRLGLATSFTSGDGGHGTLGTFHPLFPDTAYSGKLGLIGPSNGIEATPTFRFAATRRIFLLAEWSFFWRENINDGIYTPSVLTVPVDSGIVGYIEKPGNFSRARYIGNQAGIASQINIDRHLTYTLAYNYFTPGRFLKETPPAKHTGLFIAFLTYLF